MVKYSPMMQQYMEIKSEYKHCLLMFRLGDFYELFFDDAKTASRELELTLTGRECGLEQRAPMCGVPYHAVDSYIARLVEKGYKVAVCEQVEDPKLTKTIVKREVTRVITPGTLIDTNVLEEGKNNYLMCLYVAKNGYGLAFADVSTGEFVTTSLSVDEESKIIDEMAKYNPAEIITNSDSVSQKAFRVKPALYPVWAFNEANAYKALCEHLKAHDLTGFGLEKKSLSICACGALMEYIRDTQKNSLAHIRNIRCYNRDQYMVLDISSRRNLELTETMMEKSKKGSLLGVLDKTKTPMGARLIRKWLEQPLIDIEQIQKRLDAVGELTQDPLFREELKELLNTVRDIERIMSKIIYKAAGGRDLIYLANSIRYFPDIKNMLGHCGSSLHKEMTAAFDTLEDVYLLVSSAIVEEPPVSIREGGFIRDGYDSELDKLRQVKSQGHNWLLEMEAREREATGIKNLKIKYNKVFGYCIEITNGNKHLAPERYLRRQTLSNCERYMTPELKEIEEAILGADEKIAELEIKLFEEIRSGLEAQMERIQLTSAVIAAVDVIQSLAEVADKNGYVKPEVNDNGRIDIKNGRHPVVEQALYSSFVPNDTELNLEDKRLSIITGPNMAGKSTYMRQSALIVLMAQIGSFIPAESGSIGIVDRIFTRVGASDDLATGRSTFMVEMSEVANILNNATDKSMIILDEIGRGTSTFDGLSIAWSVLEYIADPGKIGAKTLFATHYHELTELEGKIDGVVNYRITVQEEGDDIVFLRKIVRGGADKSYGIHVARLAGLPDEIINRSKQILDLLNETEYAKADKEAAREAGIIYETPRRDRNKHKYLISELQNLNPAVLTPREALNKLHYLHSRSREADL